MSRLRAIVVIPARDEAEHVERCLRALAAQRGLRPAVTFETILVLDRCADEDRGGRARRRPPPRASTLHVEHSPGAGVGAARRHGMDLACGRLPAEPSPTG